MNINGGKAILVLTSSKDPLTIKKIVVVTKIKAIEKRIILLGLLLF